MFAVNDIYEWLAQQAPCELAESWDNVGVLVDAGRPVERILTTLDITPGVVREAANLGCQLIVSHHPVIFKPLRKVEHCSVVYQLIKHGISAICMHTNLDSAPGGVNDVLAQRLGLTEVQPFGEGGLGRVGQLLQPLNPEELAQQVGEELSTHLKVANARRPIRRLALVGGSGGSFWRDAQAAGADALLTGEAGHHDGIDAVQQGMTLLVAGHFSTERPMVEELARRLEAQFAQVKVTCSEVEQDPYQWM